MLAFKQIQKITKTKKKYDSGYTPKTYTMLQGEKKNKKHFRCVKYPKQTG